MKFFWFVLVITSFAAFAAGAADDSKDIDTKKKAKGKETKTVASTATTTSTSLKTVKKKVEKAKPEKNLGFGITQILQGANYYLKDSDSTTYYQIAPEVNYKIPGTKVTVGGQLFTISNLNKVDNYGHKIDLDEIDVFMVAPLWSNKSGTSLKATMVHEFWMLSTEPGAAGWDGGMSSFYTNVRLSQKVGKLSLKIQPAIRYNIDPNYSAYNPSHDLNYRLGLSYGGSFAFSKYVSAWVTQYSRRYVKSITKSPGDNNWLFMNYAGLYLSYKKVGLNTYVATPKTTTFRKSFLGSSWENAVTAMELSYSF